MKHFSISQPTKSATRYGYYTPLLELETKSSKPQKKSRKRNSFGAPLKPFLQLSVNSQPQYVSVIQVENNPQSTPQSSKGLLLTFRAAIIAVAAAFILTSEGPEIDVNKMGALPSQLGEITTISGFNQSSKPFFGEPNDRATFSSEAVLQPSAMTDQSISSIDTREMYPPYSHKSNELAFLRNSNLLQFVGKGNNHKPAIFLRAEQDNSGAALRIKYDPHFFKNSKIEFILDHPRLFSGTIRSVDDMCHKFSLAKKRFGRKIQEVYLNAHGSPLGMFLSDEGGYWTIKTTLPEGCFEDNIAEDATVILDSCSAAGKWKSFHTENIAERISRLVPRGRVIGSESDIMPLFTSYHLGENNQTQVRFGSFRGDSTRVIENSDHYCRITKG